MPDLFIPLKTEFYEAFEAGLKRNEYRLYGKRWNEKTCAVGRGVLLSKGYGKKNRLKTKVATFRKVDARSLPQSVQDDILACYGTLDEPIADIGMEDKIVRA